MILGIVGVAGYSTYCIKIIPINRLTSSKDKRLAKEFVDFVASPEGKAIFEKCGFTTYPGPGHEK
ncbi:MAG: substrate-binding domain-containing protein [Syntrophobacterales bacterium]|nr:substrate-binding domain-containing protein [Syntrophobacterales bacterium]